MNNIKSKIIMLGLVGVMLTACTDSFLDTSSKTTLNSTSFYKTQAQADYAVVGCYEMYQRTVSSGSWPSVFQAVETMSDDCLGGGGPDDRSDRLMDRFDVSYKPDEQNLFSGLWTDYYKGIYNCNLLINSLDGIDWKTDTDRKVVESEARALRAIMYFDLVRMFENVPLLTAPSSDVVPQAEPDSVYKLVVNDLRFCAQNMPEDQYTDKEKNLGRITKYAAEGMLARVYLFYDGVYNDNQFKEMPGNLTKAEALGYCEDVIAKAKAENLFSLEEEFADLWPAACTERTSPETGKKTTYKETSNELMLVMKFNNDQTWNNKNYNGNRFIVNLGMRNVSSYAPYGNGWGACPVTPYAQSLFDADDQRGTATVIDCRAVTNDNGKKAYDEQIATDCMDYTGYVNKKYCPLIFTDGTSISASEATVDGANMQTSQDQDWVLMRYADVLLMAAELGSPNAMEYFNEVRQRAYAGATDHNLQSAPTRQQIWDERRKEFMGEGIRYWDLRRQGIDAFVTAQLAQATTNGLVSGSSIDVYNNTVKDENIKSTYIESNIRSKRGFWQIPTSEINMSGGVYKQNAGW